MASQYQISRLCPDWVFSNSSNAHACKNVGWFSEYTPFRSEATGMLGEKIQVEGVGTVELPVKRAPHRKGRHSHGILRLTDVLHVPAAPCNIIGMPIIMDNHLEVSFGDVDGKSRGRITNSRGKQIAYFMPNHRFFAVKLSGPPVGPAVGPTELKPDTGYMLRIEWPNSEVQRWKRYQVTRNDSHMQGVSGPATVPETPSANVPSVMHTDKYTSVEKQWLKEHYGGEFKFLQQHGLSIYKDEDREEGRAIVRALMNNDQSNEDEEASLDDDDEESDWDHDSEAELQGHFADYNFSTAELEFIEKHYRNSENFMITHGLRFYNDEDCEEAKVLVKVFMSDD